MKKIFTRITECVNCFLYGSKKAFLNIKNKILKIYYMRKYDFEKINEMIETQTSELLLDLIESINQLDNVDIICNLGGRLVTQNKIYMNVEVVTQDDELKDFYDRIRDSVIKLRNEKRKKDKKRSIDIHFKPKSVMHLDEEVRIGLFINHMIHDFSYAHEYFVLTKYKDEWLINRYFINILNLGYIKTYLCYIKKEEPNYRLTLDEYKKIIECDYNNIDSIIFATKNVEEKEEIPLGSYVLSEFPVLNLKDNFCPFELNKQGRRNMNVNVIDVYGCYNRLPVKNVK